MVASQSQPYQGPARVLGVDVGGTFTDFILWEEGRIRTYKRPSTPSDPAVAILAGIEEAGLAADEVVHGSTVATNTVLTRRGVPTAFVTTKGFRDILRIGRQARAGADLYSLSPHPTQTLVAPETCFEADERVAADGSVLQALTEAEARRVIDEVEKSDVESVAICLLFSFLDPAHEQLLKATAQERGLHVSVSHEVLPEAREYERASTTVINAYVGPIMASYLRRLQEEIAGTLSARLRVMLSDCTAVGAPEAGEKAVRTILSGPAAGVAAAFDAAGALGYDNVLTFDMGGTSTDVAYCFGEVSLRRDALVGGLPIATPTVDVHSVGAGGGSVAYVDEAGALRVGPESAGAEPGPAAYGNGGPATVTDAHVVLGRVPPDRFLGGRMKLDAGAARAAVSDVAENAGGDADATAAAILDVADAEMERALRRVTVERGHDPREAALVAFGGAGPLHACRLAASFGISRVIVPAHPGLLSALGLVIADSAADEVLPVHAEVDRATPDPMQAELTQRIAELAGRLRREHLGEVEAQTSLFLSMRYPGQSHELLLSADALDLADVSRRFDELHQQRFGHCAPDQPPEIVSVRVRVSAPSGRTASPAGDRSGDAEGDRTRLWAGGGWVEATAYDREALAAGASFAGPALVHQMDATSLVPPGWKATVAHDLSLVMEPS